MHDEIYQSKRINLRDERRVCNEDDVIETVVQTI